MLDKRLSGEIQNKFPYLLGMVMNGFTSGITSFFQAFLIARLVEGVLVRKQAFGEQLPWMAGLLLVLGLKALAVFRFEKFFRETAGRIRVSMVKRYIGEMLHGGPLTPHPENMQSTGSKAVTVCEAADSTEPYFYEYVPQLYNLFLSVPLILLSVLYFDRISFLIMLVTAPLLPLFLSLIGRASGSAGSRRMESFLRLGGSFLDILNGMKTLKLFGQSRAFRQKVYEKSEEFRKLTMEVLRISFLSAFVLELAATISTALIAVSLGLRLMYGHMGFFEAFLVLLLTPDYYMAIRKFGTKYHVAEAARSAADVIYRGTGKHMGEETEEAETGDEESVSGVEGWEGSAQKPGPGTSQVGIEVHFRDVCFSYPGTSVPALDVLNLDIPAGQITAVVGRSGSGKSTAANALMKFLRVDSGEIRVNGVELREWPEEILRKQIAYIPQKPFIFHGSFLENLRFSNPEATMEEVSDALEKAALEVTVKGLPEGLDTVLAEDSRSLSVGEIQRIAIARALLKEAPLVILDEATSGQDEGNQRLLQRAFENLRQERTLLVIAHRLETVRNADRIHVMDKGRVVESGTHEQLMESGGLYRELVEAWEGQGGAG